MSREELEPGWSQRASVALLDVRLVMREVFERRGEDFWRSELISEPLLSESSSRGFRFHYAGVMYGHVDRGGPADLVYEQRTRGSLARLEAFDRTGAVVWSDRGGVGDPRWN